MEPGTRLGTYEIIEQLGAGGMGEVYRARDAKLDRDVAIKVLPRDLAGDHDRLALFQREAKLLAALNHANIAAIYGLEDEGSERFIVMEVVEGETLGQRIARSGRIEVDEALRIARQIAEALEFAHANRVIHRDIKPANIKITPGGQVKVLDFGIAKAWQPDGSDAAVGGSQSPTELPPTATGVIMGTVGYMSPEQARGQHVDRRADIWALGCVLYEMLAGRRAFPGDNVSDVLAAILKEQPNWSALPAEVPGTVRALLTRMLRKDPDRRLHDVADARIELEESGEVTAEFGAPTDSYAAASIQLLSARRRGRGVWQPWALVAMLGAALAWSMSHQPAGDALSPMRLDLNVHNPISTSSMRPLIALSPDGRRLVYRSGGKFFLRNFKEEEETAVQGIEGAFTPFFSPDGESLGFGSAGQSMVTLSLAGGLPLAVTAANDSLGASWGDDGYIYYSDAISTVLLRVPAGGGRSEVVTSLAPGEKAHMWPHVLPGGGAMVFTASTGGGPGNNKVVVQELGGERRVEIPRASSGRYAASGHLVYAQADDLLAVPFDLVRLELMGESITVLEGVRIDPIVGVAQFALSSTGTLAYLPAVDEKLRLIWMSRNGEMTEMNERRQLYASPRLSPDGRQLAVMVQGADGVHIWVMDRERGNLSRVTIEGNNYFPVWSPEGERLLFASDRAGAVDLYIKPADGGGEASRLTEGEYDRYPTDWVGDTIVLVARSPSTGEDVELLTLEAPDTIGPIATRPFHESAASLSPDGRRVAYRSDKTGISEVYVQSIKRIADTAEYQVSVNGGGAPVWSADGKELFFVGTEGRMMAVNILQTSPFRASAPRVLLRNDGSFQWGLPLGIRNFDVTPDGQRFLMLQRDAPATTNEVRIVLNWFKELERLVPTDP